MSHANSLHQEALKRVRTYRESESGLLEILIQISETKSHLELGYPSLHVYCTEGLGLTDAKAYELSKVAQKSKEIPEIKTLIDEGKLHLSNARRIVSVITPENKEQWLDKATTLTQRNLEKEIVKVNPKEIPREKIRPLTETKSELKVIITPDLEAKLKQVCDLLSQKTKKPVSLSEALEAIVKGFLKQNDPVQKAQRNFCPGRKTKDAPKGVRLVRAQTKHEINLRDQHQCTYHYANGNRCTAKRWVELHHILPLSHGGDNTAANLTTLCSAHHHQQHAPKHRPKIASSLRSSQ